MRPLRQGKNCGGQRALHPETSLERRSSPDQMGAAFGSGAHRCGFPHRPLPGGRSLSTLLGCLSLDPLRRFIPSRLRRLLSRPLRCLLPPLLWRPVPAFFRATSTALGRRPRPRFLGRLPAAPVRRLLASCVGRRVPRSLWRCSPARWNSGRRCLLKTVHVEGRAWRQLSKSTCRVRLLKGVSAHRTW